ncbi:MAG TPA: hypothetical protein PLA50_16510, partial [Bacteroidia bacterium]|nr:hypothetical protein [Bacteroidia bacterium]
MPPLNTLGAGVSHITLGSCISRVAFRSRWTGVALRALRACLALRSGGALRTHRADGAGHTGCARVALQIGQGDEIEPDGIADQPPLQMRGGLAELGG